MDISRKINFYGIFLFLFLIVFPFGQIIRLSLNIFGNNIPIQPIDVITGLAAIYAITKRLKKSQVFKYFLNFLIAAMFSFTLSIFIFKSSSLIYGLFYLVRLSAYVYFIIYVQNFIRRKNGNKKLLLNGLLAVSISSAAFGWIQYFLVPDIKAFFVYGWDMHLFRLVGTFLDPTFLGLIIVFGLIILINQFIQKRKSWHISVILFMLVSLAFTYSRASYLAFIAGVAVIGFYEKKIKWIVITILILAGVVAVLPTARNHSTEFFRAFSAIARVDNYKETIQIVKKFPAFGVGFDNLCLARNKYIRIESFSSHACSGSDSSILFILATTGVIGLIIFINLAVEIRKKLNSSFEAKILVASSAALLIHSLFSNSIFYPWIMGFWVILLAISLKE